MTNPVHRYRSMNEVPPELGTLSDYRFLGRQINPDATPAAKVTTAGRGEPQPLYRIEQTTPIPGLNDQDRERLRAARKCKLCGQERQNPLGKLLLPGKGQICQPCRDTARKDPR